MHEQPANLQQLRDAVVSTWSEISEKSFQQLAESMRWRIEGIPFFACKVYLIKCLRVYLVPINKWAIKALKPWCYSAIPCVVCLYPSLFAWSKFANSNKNSKNQQRFICLSKLLEVCTNTVTRLKNQSSETGVSDDWYTIVVSSNSVVQVELEATMY